MIIKRLRQTVGPLVLSLLLGCSPALALGPQATDDSRFVTLGPTIGKSVSEIVEKAGRPVHTARCTLKVDPQNPRSKNVQGKELVYIYRGENETYRLSMCYVDSIIVGEIRSARIWQDGTLLSKEQLTTDFKLLRKLLGKRDKEAF